MRKLYRLDLAPPHPPKGLTPHMATAAIPAPAPKNLQARSTVNILNVARWVGVAFFACSALLSVIMMLVGAVNSDAAIMMVGFFGIGFNLVFGALFYAFIGWYVDTLDLLTRIARDIAA